MIIGFKVFGFEIGGNAGGGLRSGNYQVLKMRLEIKQTPGAETTIGVTAAPPKEDP